MSRSFCPPSMSDKIEETSWKKPQEFSDKYKKSLHSSDKP